MALLTESERDRVARQWMRQNADACPALKGQVRQFAVDTDVWTEASIFAANGNVSVYNQGITASIRALFSASQKARMLNMVLDLKFGRLADKG